MTLLTGNFWPEEIKPKVQSPKAILQTRASELKGITKGILMGFVLSSLDGDNSYHSLDVIVPALGNIRQRLLTVRHHFNMVYPAYIDAKVFEGLPIDKRMELSISKNSYQKPEYCASTDAELLELLSLALHTDEAKSTLVSLIAMANEALERVKGELFQDSIGDELAQDPESGAAESVTRE